MPNFKKTEAELETDFDKWMYVLKHLPYLQNRPAALQERIFQKLFEAAEIARFDPVEKNRYEESLKYYMDLKNVVDTSFEEGKEEGMAEGMAKGIEKGMAKGIEEGMAKGSAQKEKEFILKSHAAGLNVETIAGITGKTVEEVRRILQEG